MDRMELYEKLRAVPESAKKTIQGGRLKGFTDVNPMWRIKRLTEVFGPCGVGWFPVPTKREIITDEKSGQRVAFMQVALTYIDPETGMKSEPVYGEGGADFAVDEKSGRYVSNEAFKMAYTDAISNAGKLIGLAADVWYENDRTKHDAPQADNAQKPHPGQLKFIREEATEEQMRKLTERYGAGLERLTRADAQKCVDKIRAQKGGIK